MAPAWSAGTYLDAPRSQSSQGDIVSVPTTTLWSLEGRGVVDGIPPFRGQFGSSVRGPLWKAPRGDPQKFASHETRTGLAMIVSHECSLDKQFNELVTRLRNAGLGASEAAEIAGKRNDLDETLVVSPVYLLSEIPAAYQRGIEQRFGYYPLPPLPIQQPGTMDLVADLSQMTTVDYRLISTTVASLTDEAVNRLRFKLSELFAYRHLSSLGELSNLIGQRIANVQVIEHSKKKTRLVLELEDGTSRIIDIKTPDEANGEREEVLRPVGTRPRAEPVLASTLGIGPMPNNVNGFRARVRMFYQKLRGRSS